MSYVKTLTKCLTHDIKMCYKKNYVIRQNIFSYVKICQNMSKKIMSYVKTSCQCFDI